jgi:hypothetical protein
VSAKITIDKNLLVLTITVVVFVALGVFVYMYAHKEAKPDLTYNYFEFYKVNDMWHTEWQNGDQVYDVGLRYSPLEVQNVTVTGIGLNSTFRRLPQYITFDPDENQSDMKYIALGVGELGLNMVRALGSKIEMACTKNLTEACADHPILTCDNDEGIYYIRTAEQPRVILAGNCLILEGKELDLIKAIDRILYSFYGIIK